MWWKDIIRYYNELPAKNHIDTRGNWGTANCNQWLSTFSIYSSRHPIQSQVSCNIFKQRFIHSAMSRKIMEKTLNLRYSFYSYKKHEHLNTYSSVPDISTSEALDISSSSDPSSLRFVRYQIYFPIPSCPPKYFLSGISSLSSQQSGIKSSIPLGSAVHRSPYRNYIRDAYNYFTIPSQNVKNKIIPQRNCGKTEKQENFQEFC